MPQRDLTPDEEEKALTWAVEGLSVIEISARLGFTHRKYFRDYRDRFPLFDKKFRAARDANGEDLEDQMNTLHLDIEDPKLARVRLEAIRSLLTFKNPQRYGPKMDLNVNQTLDLAGVLSAANARLPQPVRDVTPRQEGLDDIL